MTRQKDCIISPVLEGSVFVAPLGADLSDRFDWKQLGYLDGDLRFEIEDDDPPILAWSRRQISELTKPLTLTLESRVTPAMIEIAAGTHWRIPVGNRFSAGTHAPMTLVNKAKALAALTEAGLIPQQKETTMIDKKKFQTHGNTFGAKMLSHTEIGALVKKH